MLSRERLHAHNQSFERASQPRWYAAEVATDPTAVIRRKEKREREKKKETRKRRKNKMKKRRGVIGCSIHHRSSNNTLRIITLNLGSDKLN